MNSKLIITATAVILIITIVLLYNLHLSSEKEVVQRFRVEQQVASKQLAREIKLYLQNRSRGVEVISGFDAFQNSDMKEIKSTVDGYFEYLKKDHIKEISVYDEKGVIVYSTNKEAIGQSCTKSNFFKWAAQKENKGKQFISSLIPHLDNQTKMPHYFHFLIVAPIYCEEISAGKVGKNTLTQKPTNKFVGIVSFSIDLEEVVADFLPLVSPYANKEDAYILDRKGTVLFHSKYPEMALKSINNQDKTCYSCHTSFDHVKTILSENEGTIEYSLKDMPKKLASFTSVEFMNISWKLAITIPQKEISSFINKNLYITIALIGLILFIVTGSSLQIHKSNKLTMIAQEEAKQLLTEKELEDKIRESEEHYRKVVDISPDAIVIHSEGKIVFANSAAVELAGASSPNDILGKPAIEFVHPDERETVRERISEIFKTGKSSWEEERFIKLDGSTTYVETIGTSTTHDGIPAVQVIIHEITERRRTEIERQVIYEITQGVTTTSNLDELLKLIHHSIEKVVYAANCFVALYDPNTGLFSFPYFVDKFDSAPPPLPLEKSCTAYVFRSGKPLLLTLELFDKLLEQNKVELVGSNSPSWLGVPLLTPSRTIGVLVLQHYEDENVYNELDVRFLDSVGSQIAVAIERKRAEDELRESEEMFRRLFDESADPILLLEDSGFTNCNPSTVSILNYSSKEEFLNKKPWELSPEKQPDGLLSSEKAKMMIDKAIEEGYNRFEWIHTKSDGSDLPVEVMLTPIQLKGKQYLYTIWRDITVRKRAEEEIINRNQQLFKLNSEKDKFFSIIAHDLKSPFVGLLGLTEMIASGDESFTKDKLMDYSRSIHESASTLYRLIENLLEWAQIQRGLISYTLKEIELQKIVSQSIESIKYRAMQKGITLINEISGTEKVYVDEKMINTVLRNLLSNAVKFTRKDGKVIVRCKKMNKELIEISVSDTGVGISKDNLNKLFKIEEKVSSKGTDDEPSTGLGLLLCKEFVEKNGGRIWVESEVGKGTTFTFSLLDVI